MKFEQWKTGWISVLTALWNIWKLEYKLKQHGHSSESRYKDFDADIQNTYKFYFSSSLISVSWNTSSHQIPVHRSFEFFRWQMWRKSPKEKAILHHVALHENRQNCSSSQTFPSPTLISDTFEKQTNTETNKKPPAIFSQFPQNMNLGGKNPFGSLPNNTTQIPRMK